MRYEIKKSFRINRHINDVIVHNANELRMTESEYLRCCVVNRPADNKELRSEIIDLQYEINKIGNNVNQIAHRNNMNIYTQQDKEKLFLSLEAINLKMDEIVRKIRNI